jgi:hypothetical protein
MIRKCLEFLVVRRIIPSTDETSVIIHIVETILPGILKMHFVEMKCRTILEYEDAAANFEIDSLTDSKWSSII